MGLGRRQGFSWVLFGNSGIDDDNQFIGTTDNADVVLKANNATVLRLKEDNQAIQRDDDGDPRGTLANDFQAVRSSTASVAAAARSGLFAGSDNSVSGNDSVVTGGVGNGAHGDACMVGCGETNRINENGRYSFIGGGQANLISATASGIGNSILGGQQNSVLSPSDRNVIVGGINNIINSTEGSNHIGCGENNEIRGEGTSNFIGAGSTNIISATAGNNSIVGGNGNQINQGNQSFIGGGGTNIIVDGQLATIVNGIQNTINDRGTGSFNIAFNQILNGLLNNISASTSFNTIINGQRHIMDEAGGTIINGDSVRTRSYGQIAWNADAFDSSGTAQSETAQANDYILIAETTTSATARMSITVSSGNDIVIPSDTTMLMEVDVVAMEQQTGGGTDSAGFVRRVLIENRGGTTALVGSVQTIGTDIGSNVGLPPIGWSVTITADNTTDTLNITVQGTADNIRWVARVKATQVAYP